MKSIGFWYLSAVTFISVIFTAVVISLVYIAFDYDRNNAAEHFLHRAQSGLEQTFRGVNEVFLTSGTPDSISIINDGEMVVDEAISEFIAINKNTLLESHLKHSVTPLWQHIKDRLPRLKITNGINADNEQLLRDYGALLVVNEQLKARLDRVVDLYNLEISERNRDLVIILAAVMMLLVYIWYKVLAFIKNHIVAPCQTLQETIKKLSENPDFESLHTGVEQLRDSMDLQSGTTLVSELHYLSEAFLHLNERLCAQLQQRASYENDLKHMATHDVLTGLANRGLFDEELNRLVSLAKRQESVFAVGMIDLNEFKPINDRYGHAFGDQLLREVGARMARACRKSDLLARIGGDEFAFTVSSIEGVEQAQLGAERIMDSLKEPFLIDETLIRVSCSIGLACYPNDGLDPDALMRFADEMMYQVKSINTNKPKLESIVTDVKGTLTH